MNKPESYRFSHFGICVSDLEASMRFYERVLGFTPGECYKSGNEVDKLLGLEGVDQRAQWMHHPSGIIIELLYYISPVAFGDRKKPPHNKIGFTHMGFFVDDLDEAVRIAVENGGLVREGSMGQIGNCRMGGCIDPDGIAIGMMQLVP